MATGLLQSNFVAQQLHSARAVRAVARTVRAQLGTDLLVVCLSVCLSCTQQVYEMARDEDMASRAVDAGAVDFLMPLLRSRYVMQHSYSVFTWLHLTHIVRSDIAVVAAATQALGALAQRPKLAPVIARSGVVPQILSLLQPLNSAAQISSPRSLMRKASRSGSRSNMLQPDTSALQLQLLRATAFATTSLARSSEETRAAAVSGGGVKAALSVLPAAARNNDDAVGADAATALAEMARNEAGRVACIKENVPQGLADALSAGPALSEQLAMSLCAVASNLAAHPDTAAGCVSARVPDALMRLNEARVGRRATRRGSCIAALIGRSAGRENSDGAQRRGRVGAQYADERGDVTVRASAARVIAAMASGRRAAPRAAADGRGGRSGHHTERMHARHDTPAPAEQHAGGARVYERGPRPPLQILQGNPTALDSMVKFGNVQDTPVQVFSSMNMDRMSGNSDDARRRLMELGALAVLAAMLKYVCRSSHVYRLTVCLSVHRSKNDDLLRSASHAMLRVAKDGEGLVPHMAAVVRHMRLLCHLLQMCSHRIMSRRSRCCIRPTSTLPSTRCV